MRYLKSIQKRQKTNEPRCSACPYLVKVWTAEDTLSQSSFRYVSPGYHNSPMFFCEHPDRNYPSILLHGEYFPKIPAPADCPYRKKDLVISISESLQRVSF